jgi:hypothetical protein
MNVAFVISYEFYLLFPFIDFWYLWNLLRLGAQGKYACFSLL